MSRDRQRKGCFSLLSFVRALEDRHCYEIQTTNLRVGRSNRSGRAIYLLHVSSIFRTVYDATRLKFAFSLGFSLGKFFAGKLRCFPFRIGSVTAPNPPLLGEPKPERHQAVKAEAAKRGRDSASLYG
jgi:hypothetical protein